MDWWCFHGEKFMFFSFYEMREINLEGKKLEYEK